MLLRKGLEETIVEHGQIEKEIFEKAKEWVDDYGEDFLIELIDVYLDDTPTRLAQMQRAVDNGDADTLSREAHTLKSSSANVGAMTLSAIAQRIEQVGRAGSAASAAREVRQMTTAFTQVKATLQALRHAPGEYIAQER
jgi:HPt (histidine-containing phosphotransfer) domain-containing protein